MTLDVLDMISREGVLIFFLLFFCAVTLWVVLGPDSRFQHDAELPLHDPKRDDD